MWFACGMQRRENGCCQYTSSYTLAKNRLPMSQDKKSLQVNVFARHPIERRLELTEGTVSPKFHLLAAENVEPIVSWMEFLWRSKAKLGFRLAASLFNS